MHMYTQIILINHLLHQIIFEIFFTFKPRYTLREIRYPRISEIACLLLIGRRRITLDFENWKPRESMRFRFKAKKAFGYMQFNVHHPTSLNPRQNILRVTSLQLMIAMTWHGLE